jgi:hypothetical protein
VQSRCDSWLTVTPKLYLQVLMSDLQGAVLTHKHSKQKHWILSCSFLADTKLDSEYFHLSNIQVISGLFSWDACNRCHRNVAISFTVFIHPSVHTHFNFGNNNGHFPWRGTSVSAWISSVPSHIFLWEQEMFWTKVVEKFKTRVLCIIHFFHKSWCFLGNFKWGLLWHAVL